MPDRTLGDDGGRLDTAFSQRLFTKGTIVSNEQKKQSEHPPQLWYESLSDFNCTNYSQIKFSLVITITTEDITAMITLYP
jgi:hypothetical protein